MKTTPMKVSLLALAMLAIGCNEQVAPELKNGSVSSSVPTPTPTTTPDEFYFRIVDSSLPVLDYKLHRTGDGRGTVKCEINKTVPLSNELYRADTGIPHDLKQSDITCFLEAEELSLFFNGLKFKIEASPNTCEYIGYSPFSYFDRVPGDSTTNLTHVKCTNDATTDGHAASEGAPAGCGKMIDTTIGGAAIAFDELSDRDLCRFNYTAQGGPNCDIGNITLKTHSVTYDSTATTTKSEFSTRYINCGGKIASCVGGPINLEPQTIGKVSGRAYFQSEKDKPFSKEIVLPPLLSNSVSGGNRDYVNFRRMLASVHLDFEDKLSVKYTQAFSDPLYSKAYDPSLMDKYSSNKNYDGTQLVSPTLTTNANGYKAQPYAAEAFVAVKGEKTNPFYTFYCYNNTLDSKARIRLVVRDWDRLYVNDNNFELISDIDLGENGRQDSPISLEVPDDEDDDNVFNDKQDWDDLLIMERSPGLYTHGATTWVLDAGFFKQANFPNGGFE